tara:strand:- start:89 stop:472 length:384 start_codon:yes stop_codon:yes gene_type:complete
MRLTKKILDRMIMEEMDKQGNIPFKSDYEREEHLRKQQEEAEERRQKKKAIRPDYDLMRLSKGILQEQELLAEPDDEGFVKIKASALQRVLNEQQIDVEKTCNRQSYYKLDQILDFIKRMNQAQKGK